MSRKAPKLSKSNALKAALIAPVRADIELQGHTGNVAICDHDSLFICATPFPAKEFERYAFELTALKSNAREASSL
jgi:hypothetical protein